AKPVGDVRADARRGGRRESERDRVAELLANRAEPQVGRAKVVPPLGDAVSLVDAEERRSSALETGRGDARLQRLRRGEDDEAAAAFDLLECGATLSLTQPAVEHDDGDAAASQRALLVRHEGDEW